MVKYGKQYREFQVQEWVKHYIDYKGNTGDLETDMSFFHLSTSPFCIPRRSDHLCRAFLGAFAALRAVLIVDACQVAVHVNRIEFTLTDA